MPNRQGHLGNPGLEDGNEIDGLHVGFVFPAFALGHRSFIALAGQRIDALLIVGPFLEQFPQNPVPELL